jgi:hypothetical protein
MRRRKMKRWNQNESPIRPGPVPGLFFGILVAAFLASSAPATH